MPDNINITNFLPAYDDMVKSGMHFGRKKTIFHPNMKPYIYTLKDNIYILDLIKTGDKILKAIEFLRKALSDGKTVLFVGLTKQSADSIKEIATQLNMPFVVNRWLGGSMTNFKTIIERVKYLDSLEKEKAEGGFDKYTKKEQMLKNKEVETLKEKFGCIRKLTKIPDVLFVSSLKESQLPV